MLEVGLVIEVFLCFTDIAFVDVVGTESWVWSVTISMLDDCSFMVHVVRLLN